jgi:hypothetical protein
MTTTAVPVLVANPDPVHVGGHLMAAARAAGVELRLCDLREAYAAPVWRRKVDWWFRGRRPSALRSFSEHVLLTAVGANAGAVITTGIAPLDAAALEALGRRGVRRLNFLTDDPWNPEHHAPWFMQALPHYDHVFTPRRANMTQLQALGGPAVTYLPFAYAPEAHFPEPAPAAEASRFRADVVFAGGADPDRVRYATPLIAAGFDVALYGGYWDRYPATRACARGMLDGRGLRHAIAGGAVCLCLVRRANRDGHAMRSFEVAAMGGCMLVEDTAEHRDLFGPDGDAVVYFSSPDDAVARTRELVADSARRRRLALRVRELIGRPEHTYAARLREMLRHAAASRDAARVAS